MSSLIPGRLVDDRFLIEDRAASGGMGTVFRAQDLRDGGLVALKILHCHDFVDVERFVREAAILAELDHPAIVRYVGHGFTGSGEHYLAMEWLEGEDLAARLARRALTEAETFLVMRQAADALSAAHARGTVHRDIKPSNLFLRGKDIERLAVVDFGIAGIEGTSKLTQTGTILGTPGYAAPEQVQGAASHDPRSDIFSLGCVLFECLAHRPAFEGSTPMAVLAKLLLGDVPRLAEIRPNTAEALDELVARMLAKEPSARPQSVDEVAQKIAAIAAAAAAKGARISQPITLGSSGVTRPTPALGLTRDEQRLVTVVLAGRTAPAGSTPGPHRTLSVGLAAAVEPRGGHLTTLAGGALIVTTWAPGTAVDRAERAALCALAIRERFPELPVAVVTGRGRVASRVVEGAVIERAVKALAIARAGTVRLDDTTAAMIAQRFDLARDGDEITLLAQAEASNGIPVSHKSAPCVGRNRELAVLEGIFEGCVSEPVASGVLVTGPAGAGKSHLRREFVDRLMRRGDPFTMLMGRADLLTGGKPWSAIADLITRAAEIVPSDAPEARREKLLARLGPRLDGRMLARVASLLGELVGAPASDGGDSVIGAARDNPLLMGEVLRAAWEEWLLAECSAQPVLLVLEDLQWSDAATASLLDSTLRNLRDLPLMILALARPEAPAELFAVWSKRDVPVVKLGPLPARACEKLVRDALGPAATDPIVRRIVERSGGNPFYLEELVRAAASGRGDTLPESVLGTVEARLDAEGAEAKRILRAASIFGDRFSAAGIAALLGDARGATVDDVRRSLSHLASHELIALASTGGGGGAEEYVFGSPLVREAGYATLTDADRALGHRLAGAFLEGAAHPDPLLIAEHFTHGVEPKRAARWFLAAAEDALARGDLTAALQRAARGVGGASVRELAGLRIVEAEVHLARGDLPAAESRALEVATLLDLGDAHWFHAVRCVMRAAAQRGALDLVESWAGPAVTVQPLADARDAQLACLEEAARLLMEGGRLAAARPVVDALERVSGTRAPTEPAP